MVEGRAALPIPIAVIPIFTLPSDIYISVLSQSR
jgi:hypothetical protein